MSSNVCCEVNRRGLNELYDGIPTSYLHAHIDIASGTGLVTDYFLSRGYGGTIIGVDPNPVSLAIAEKKVHPASGNKVTYIEGFGQDLPQLVEGRLPEGLADSATFNDAIHELGNREEQQDVLDGVSTVLRDGAPLFINSGFTTLSDSAGGRMELGRWRLAIGELTGLKRLRRNKAEGERVIGITENSPEAFGDMLKRAGFEQHYTATRKVIFDKEAIEAICLYPRFTQSLFHELEGQEALSDTEKAQIAILGIQKAGLREVPRVWFETIAVKVREPQSEAA